MNERGEVGVLTSIIINIFMWFSLQMSQYVWVHRVQVLEQHLYFRVFRMLQIQQESVWQDVIELSSIKMGVNYKISTLILINWRWQRIETTSITTDIWNLKH